MAEICLNPEGKSNIESRGMGMRTNKTTTTITTGKCKYKSKRKI